MQKLGELLRKKRLAAGFTQMNVAKKAGLSSAQFISNVERGIAGPPLSMLGMMIRLYRINPEEAVKIIIDISKVKLRKHLF